MLHSVLDFETQREKLLSAADKPDRVDVIVRKFSKRAPEIKKNAIEPPASRWNLELSFWLETNNHIKHLVIVCYTTLCILR